MESVGWAAEAVAGLGGCALVLGYVLDLVPALSDKAVRAIDAWRRLRDEWRRLRDERRRK
ncbi:hypothetical protein [Streptomyces sp. NPDC094437]|uniref:hypothetical protein n=1 Tax=Streptomyces sp. NPDC094437 TaxID=3366060 RepID=UPI003817FDA5